MHASNLKYVGNLIITFSLPLRRRQSWSRVSMTFYYNNEFQVNILYTSNRIIYVKAEIMGKKFSSRFLWIPSTKMREQIWESLTRYGLVRTEPWFVIGNLNEITGNYEKQGGHLRRLEYNCHEYQRILACVGLRVYWKFDWFW